MEIILLWHVRERIFNVLVTKLMHFFLQLCPWFALALFFKWRPEHVACFFVIIKSKAGKINGMFALTSSAILFNKLIREIVRTNGRTHKTFHFFFPFSNFYLLLLTRTSTVLKQQKKWKSLFRSQLGLF